MTHKHDKDILRLTAELQHEKQVRLFSFCYREVNQHGSEERSCDLVKMKLI